MSQENAEEYGAGFAAGHADGYADKERRFIFMNRSVLYVSGYGDGYRAGQRERRTERAAS